MNSRASLWSNHASPLVGHAESIGWREVGRRKHNGLVVVKQHLINKKYIFMSLQEISIVYAHSKVSPQSCHLWARMSTSYVENMIAAAVARQATGCVQACCLIILYASSAISILSAGPGEGQHIICFFVWKHQNTFDTSLFLFVDVGLQHLRWCYTNTTQNYARVLSTITLPWSCNGLCNYFLGVVF